MNIKIITDSTSDISQKEAKDLGISVIPLHVIFPEGEYKDGIDLSPEEFYERLKTSPTLPSTSQLTPEQFLPYFEESKKNKDILLVITVSSLLSGTYQSAVIAKDIVDYNDIYIIDSLTVTLGLQILVKKALELLKLGYTAEALAQTLEKIKHKIKLYAIIDNLEYLKKGGRLSGVGALAGTILNIKPIVEVTEGKLRVASKARGMTSAYQKTIQLIEQCGGINYHYPYSIGYSANQDNMRNFLNTFNNLNVESGNISPIGSVVGTHAGPGACGIAFFTNEID